MRKPQGRRPGDSRLSCLSTPSPLWYPKQLQPPAGGHVPLRMLCVLEAGEYGLHTPRSQPKTCSSLGSEVKVIKSEEGDLGCADRRPRPLSRPDQNPSTS
jgi:hypothetical protein